MPSLALEAKIAALRITTKPQPTMIRRLLILKTTMKGTLKLKTTLPTETTLKAPKMRKSAIAITGAAI